jgi:hypothetical protein
MLRFVLKDFNIQCRQQSLLHPCYRWLNNHIITLCWWHLSHWILCREDQHHLSTTLKNLWHGGFVIVDSFSWIGIHLSTWWVHPYPTRLCCSNFGWIWFGKLQSYNFSHDRIFTFHKRHGRFFGRCPFLLMHGRKI